MKLGDESLDRYSIYLFLLDYLSYNKNMKISKNSRKSIFKENFPTDGI